MFNCPWNARAVRRLPGVVFRCRSVTRENLVQAPERLRVELQFVRLDGGLELLKRARADNRGGDSRLMEQPRERDVCRFLAQLRGEVLVAPNLFLMQLQCFDG